jgi:EAL domain-containing protein (putative c-di-GMP-specific phosphodiesterase class I)
MRCVNIPHFECDNGDRPNGLVVAMKQNEIPEQLPIFATFGRRKVRPHVCVIDSKQHIRTFLCEALEDLEFKTCECADNVALKATLRAQLPDPIVLGLSGGGEDGAEALKTLAVNEFGGRVLLLGPRASPVLGALQELGEKLGLEMLPALSTPFGRANLRDSVAMLLPIKLPQPPVEVAEALSAGWLDLWYQPKIDVRTVSVVGAEALVRLRHPTWGIVTPAYFIPDNADPQFRAMSEFIIDRAIHDWHDFIADGDPIEIAINLPMSFLQDEDAIRGFCLKMPNHPAFEGLTVEINGIEIIRNLAQAKALARQLRFHNIGISIDDLGAEWPSLMAVPDFPFVEVKVDRKFVTGCADDPLKQMVCSRILALANDYGTRTVAEGVKTTADFLAVREMGFDLAQGFLFSKPIGAKKFRQTVLLRQSRAKNPRPPAYEADALPLEMSKPADIAGNPIFGWGTRIRT